MIVIKNEDQIARMAVACEVAGNLLKELRSFIRPGLTTKDIDHKATAGFPARPVYR